MKQMLDNFWLKSMKLLPKNKAALKQEVIVIGKIPLLNGPLNPQSNEPIGI